MSNETERAEDSDEDDFEQISARHEEELTQEFDRYYRSVEQRCKGSKDNRVTCRREGNTLVLTFPKGRSTYDLTLGTFDMQRIDDLLSFEFEKVRFVEEYAAFFMNEGASMEVNLIPLNNETKSWVLDYTYSRELEQGSKKFLPIDSYSSNHDGATSIRINHTSNIMDILLAPHEQPGEPANISVTVSGPIISRQEQAITLLHGAVNSFLFELHMRCGLSFSLERWINGATKYKVDINQDKEIRFPRSKYDSTPLQLYFHALSIPNLPLLQYLVYYQSIEYYFPIYSDIDTRIAIKNMLNDPTFDAHIDADIARLLLMAKGANTRGYGDERSQIRSTIHHCLTVESLKEFISDDEERERYLTKGKDLGVVMVSFADSNYDLRAQVAERIYDIRCRIVHTKPNETSTSKPLFPFSKEARNLQHDIALVQFVAQCVLIAGTSPLS